MSLWLWACHSLEVRAGGDPRDPTALSFLIDPSPDFSPDRLIDAGEPAQGILGKGSSGASSTGDIITRPSPHQEVVTTQMSGTGEAGNP